ncbi:MAG: hypothetical protein COA50_04570 [Flavobacteriaceae bacterium]|nr:MAG: hypothetical protein COA50_04570 [Flavobacteriaceae bacterium]
MAKQVQPSTPQPSDEIDLGQLFKLIGRGFDTVFTGFLRVFLYLKKNLVVLLILGIIGLGAGYGLGKIIERLKKTEVIVNPNFESKDYLYGVVKELQSKIKGKDTTFYNALGIDLDAVRGFKIEVAPVQEVDDKLDLGEDLKYLEFLGDHLKDDNSIKQVVKNAVISSSYVNHKITFYYKNADFGQDAAIKIMRHINENLHFNELKEIYLKNSAERIAENIVLMKQIDVLIENYSKALGNKSEQPEGDGMVMLGGEQGLNIPSLFNLKNTLIQSTATNKLAIKHQQDTIQILNFGLSQEIEKNFFNHGLFLIPFILIGLFFVWSFIKFLNKKSLELV